MISRDDRYSDRFAAKQRPDFRTPAQRDCDRLLYSAALRRLAVITQVVSPAGGHAVHNRLTHALKVAQVGGRIAQKFRNSGTANEIDPDVVTAAGLAHDLGHPPFGHVAEEVLNKCLLRAGEQDGYEGNAQSFRIVTKLEVREPGLNVRKKTTQPLGLDLTRASLKAMLKYPWRRPCSNWLWSKIVATDDHPKFGAYRTENHQFDFANAGYKAKQKSLEAQIMDWADDITYAVHDLVDFYRVGMIPLGQMSAKEIDDFLTRMFYRTQIPTKQHELYRNESLNFFQFSPVARTYTGSGFEKAALSSLTSKIIREAVDGTTVQSDLLDIKPQIYRQVKILKELTWQYVIENPRMAPQQEGKRRLIRELFNTFASAAGNKKEWKLFPVPFQEQLKDARESAPRVAADFIASLGEQRAVELFTEITGTSLKPVVTGLPI